MFGNILPDPSCLSEEQNRRYRAGYCGLCRTLKTEYGLWPRLTLSYDMTFLLLLLSSLYEPEETWGEARCAAHPTKKHSYFQNRYSSYTAAINTVLTFYKCLDD